jgi:D-glycero-alpha-D-manno-heptose-7-phosphate kinase
VSSCLPVSDDGAIMDRVEDPPVPIRIVQAATPIRVCDNGGWTDTWFAGHGQVFNIAVSPLVEVRITVYRVDDVADRIVLEAGNYDQRYAYDPGSPAGRHPLLEATVDEIGLPEDVAVEVSLSSEAPPGGSTGSSASATVALIGALDALTPGRKTPSEIAALAHRIESERLGMESGVQDQLCAAFGGINYIEVTSYPDASLSQLTLPETAWQALDRRLVLVHLGGAHVSTELHRRVIATLSSGAVDAEYYLEQLRQCAADARDAVLAADFAALGRAMSRNTDVQRELHPSLVGERAEALIDGAAAHGVLGWKVNGAGGDGGSVTLLCGADSASHRRVVETVQGIDASFRVIPTALSRAGLRVWDASDVSQ